MATTRPERKPSASGAVANGCRHSAPWSVHRTVCVVFRLPRYTEVFQSFTSYV
ncbi:hypothetical protein ABT024_01550 [Streptomyces sp. NPDC002812]|uniref:hypothetical protein n=1 Tax=Streptomyces sp. NPDC002812 TaxID=3154434 RepID=UPI00332A4F40